MNPMMLLLAAAAYFYIRKKEATAAIPPSPYTLPPSQATTASQLAPSSDSAALSPSPAPIAHDPDIVQAPKPPTWQANLPAPFLPVDLHPAGVQQEQPISLPAKEGYLKPISADTNRDAVAASTVTPAHVTAPAPASYTSAYPPADIPYYLPVLPDFRPAGDKYLYNILMWESSSRRWVPKVPNLPQDKLAYVVLNDGRDSQVLVSSLYPFFAYIDSRTNLVTAPYNGQLNNGQFKTDLMNP